MLLSLTRTRRKMERYKPFRYLVFLVKKTWKAYIMCRGSHDGGMETSKQQIACLRWKLLHLLLLQRMRVVQVATQVLLLKR